MKRALAFLVFTLAVYGFPTAVLGQAEGPTVTKAPKLVKFVPAVYPKDKHDAGITASVTSTLRSIPLARRATRRKESGR